MKEILCAYQSYNDEFECFNPNAFPKDWIINGRKTVPYTHGGQFFTWESLNYDYSVIDRVSCEELISMGAKPTKQEYLKNYLDFKLLDDIPAGQKYIYHISVHQIMFFYYNRHIGFDYIHPRVIQDVKNKIAKIVILFPHEGNTGIIEKNSQRTHVNSGALIVDEWCKRAGFNKSDVYFIHGNLLADTFDTIVENYTSRSIDTFGTWLPKEYMHTTVNIPSFEPINNQNLFLCYNRNVRLNRQFLLIVLKHKELFSRGLISCGDKINENQILHALGQYNCDYLIPAAKEICKITPIELDQNLKINNPAVDIYEPHYKQTFISLIPETHYEDGILFRSEKIYKTLAVGHPFIVFSCSGFLKSLKNLGFKTFDHWINESYDDATNWIERLNMITDEIKRLSLLDTNQLVKIRNEMAETIQYNKNLMKKIYMTQTSNVKSYPLYVEIEKVWKSF